MDIPRKMVEAGARALYEAEPNYEDDPVCPWEKLGPGTQKRYADQAEAAIRAAIGCAEVVGDNTTGEDEVFWGKNGSTHTIHPGDTIIIVRGEP